MGYLEEASQKQYYQGTSFGDYQFVSLDDIINQFQIMYVGEDKLIPKAKRADIAFHAKRALAELSFDTFKSFKSQQIDVPPSLTMILPHDYVNYTKISRVDRVGIKHPLYPTRHTSNPFQIKQLDTGEYDFPVTTDANSTASSLLLNGDFANDLLHYQFTDGKIDVVDGALRIVTKPDVDQNNSVFGPTPAVWQQINVSQINFLDLSATVVAPAATGLNPAGVIRIGISATGGDENINPNDVTFLNDQVVSGSTNGNTNIFLEDSYLEWNGTGAANTQTLYGVDVSEYDNVFVLITNSTIFTSTLQQFVECTIDDISVTNSQAGQDLQHASDGINSSSWTNFKNADSITVDIDDYRYPDVYLDGPERYGLNPEHAQVNGDFYIDQRLGKIHFSSNINGKTVILDYISDSLGTDVEMQVPKLAEDAMYKHILYDVISTRSNIGGSRLSFHKREKFAAVRKAKLRLSNIKLEEITQILRGQSKQIKH